MLSSVVVVVLMMMMMIVTGYVTVYVRIVVLFVIVQVVTFCVGRLLAATSVAEQQEPPEVDRLASAGFLCRLFLSKAVANLILSLE